MNKQYFQDLIKGTSYGRKDIYTLLKYKIAMEYGVDLEEWQIQKIVRAHRTLQELIPNDEKGKKLEAKWRDEHGMKAQSEFVADSEGQMFSEVTGNVLRYNQ